MESLTSLSPLFKEALTKLAKLEDYIKEKLLNSKFKTGYKNTDQYKVASTSLRLAVYPVYDCASVEEQLVWQCNLHFFYVNNNKEHIFSLFDETVYDLHERILDILDLFISKTLNKEKYDEHYLEMLAMVKDTRHSINNIFCNSHQIKVII
jgi:hypothetical protein